MRKTGREVRREVGEDKGSGILLKREEGARETQSCCMPHPQDLTCIHVKTSVTAKKKFALPMF